MTYYSIWKDVSFYIYLLLAVLSIVTIVVSIRKLFEGSEEEEVDIPSDSFDITSDTEKDYQEGESLLQDNQSMTLETSQEKVEEEEIVFKKEETIFDINPKEVEADLEKEDIIKKEDKALVFLKSLNENLSTIKDGIDRLSEIEKKIVELEKRINSLEISFREILKDELSQSLSQIKLAELDYKMRSQKHTTPKYLSKYLEDILEDFETLERDVIKKRIKVIAEDLKKISGEG